MSTPQFHLLTVKRVRPEAAGAVAITFSVPPDLRDAYAFTPGQFLTLRANVNVGPAAPATTGTQGEALNEARPDLLRRSYSICSSTQRFDSDQEIDVGIKPVPGGVFSNWAVTLQAGDRLEVMTPEGRFSPRMAPADVSGRALHRVALVAGSGITPVLSILASRLRSERDSRFTLVYANKTTQSIMFNEALQDLKDQHPARLNLVHVLSRQAQDVPMLYGRLDALKVSQLLASLLPPGQIDEAFVCGPEGMIDAVEQALLRAGLVRNQIHSERFFSADNSSAIKNISNYSATTGTASKNASQTSLEVVLDGKTHALTLSASDKILDVALAAGLDLPFACRAGVCCTCRARVLEGRVEMEKNYTLEAWEVNKGFVLTCQARALTPCVVMSFDEH